MTAEPEKVLSQKTVYQGPIFSVQQELVALPNRNETAQRDIVHHGPSVVILPLLDADHALMVRQWRAPVAEVVDEFPAGKLDSRDAGDAHQAVIRELNEELRVKPQQLTRAFSFYQAVGFSDGEMSLWVAQGLDKLPVKDQDEQDWDENLDVEKVTFDQLGQWLASGRLKDQKSIMAYLYWAQLRRQDAGEEFIL
ncbi:NUDIX hydrolase [Lactobacillaceae bacterium L1_55_11]|nr:NUDIX hydrolase [Lactobacillaceae bacterium L1_55_11]